MMDTVKPTATAVQIAPSPFRCTSVDPEGTTQARTFCTAFNNAYNFVLERSSKYTVGVPQSSIKEGELCVYKSLFSLVYTCVLLKYF